MHFDESRRLQQKAHAIIPGGCHTYAKGDDQYPLLSPGFIARGLGCHIWDVDGNEFIEYGMGNRCVTLGHAYEPVVRAAREAMLRGANFGRPSPLEVECAETLLELITGAEMVKFAKDGSSVTTGAVKLARAYTGRDLVAVCSDHPFFATHDWFIGTTPLDAGIPQAVKDLTVGFRYNDVASVRRLFTHYPNQIACLIMEPAKYEDPENGFLHEVQRICHQHGAVFILDEMITGFRWHVGGAQRYYDIVPDLSAFGKALANGFSVSGLVGRREIMELGGLDHDRERVFLLSTTHGAETHALAAAIATMRVYRSEGVVERLYTQGERLRTGATQVIEALNLAESVQILGKPCSLVYATNDGDGKPSQAFRSLFIQELVKQGVFGPSLVVSYSHSDEDIDRTVEAIERALTVYARALDEGIARYLVGPPSQSVYRRYNNPPPAETERIRAVGS